MSERLTPPIPPSNTFLGMGDLRANPFAAPSYAARPPLALGPLLMQALDEMDYGVLLLDEDFRVLHANHLAHADLRGEHPLQLHGQELRVRHIQDQRGLEEALRAAVRRGIRRLIALGTEETGKVSVSVVPLSIGGEPRAPALMLALGKRQLCASLTVQGFARMHRLSPGEEQVLVALCKGVRPTEIAKQHGVALSTIRTQITNIRTKTGADSIRMLVRSVSMLPPLVGALRQSTFVMRETVPSYATPQQLS